MVFQNLKNHDKYDLSNERFQAAFHGNTLFVESAKGYLGAL